jgi:hypothetical protein
MLAMVRFTSKALFLTSANSVASRSMSALDAKIRTFPSRFDSLKYRLRLSSQTVATKVASHEDVVKVSLRSAVRFQVSTSNLVSLRRYRNWETLLLVSMSVSPSIGFGRDAGLERLIVSEIVALPGISFYILGTGYRAGRRADRLFSIPHASRRKPMANPLGLLRAQSIRCFPQSRRRAIASDPNKNLGEENMSRTFRIKNNDGVVPLILLLPHAHAASMPAQQSML